MITSLPSPARATMNGKPVFAVPSKTVLNLTSGFAHKLLCDGLTFSTGSACAYSCAFCYVPDMMRKLQPWLAAHGVTGRHEDIVIRRTAALATLARELALPKARALADRPLVIYSSPSVDVAANLDLCAETVAACQLILTQTAWHIRLLSKSHLLPRIAAALESHRDRIIYGVSTGTLDDGLARAFEQGAPLVSKRLASLHALQDQGFRTFGMLCPSLPCDDYPAFAREMKSAIRADRCEHVWGEVINVRGESFTRTEAALLASGFAKEAAALRAVSHDKTAWETYARATFLAHAEAGYAPGQLRFLQYVTKDSRPWWEARQPCGAILL